MNQFQKALSDALTKDGQLHQKINNLSQVQQKEWFEKIKPLMILDNGFYPSQGAMKRTIDDSRRRSDFESIDRAKLVVEKRAFYFEFYSGVEYWYQRSFDDCVFVDECMKIVGCFSFEYILEIDIIPPQRMFLEFFFTEKFVDKLNKTF